MKANLKERIVNIATKEFPIYMAGVVTYWRTIGPFHFIYAYDDDEGTVCIDLFKWRIYKAECEKEIELGDWYDQRKAD